MNTETTPVLDPVNARAALDELRDFYEQGGSFRDLAAIADRHKTTIVLALRAALKEI